MKYFPYPITAAALANCLGNTSERVFANALGGAACFSTSDEAFAGLPFRVPVGLMKDLAPRDTSLAWRSRETRIFRVVYASIRQLQAPVARATARWGKHRVSYVYASSTGGLEHTEDTFANGPDPVAPLSEDAGVALLADHAMHATNDDVADYLGIEGYRYVVTTACSSSMKALKSAVRLIEGGHADAVLVGCADSLCRTTLYGFRSLGILPDLPTRPFAQDRAGLTLGEGSAYVLIERSAVQADTLAWLSGVGESSDAYHPSSPDPTGKGALASMREALSSAGLPFDAIDHVAAHATGTLQNDAMESAAIHSLFPEVPITGTKSLTGHTLGAAGLTSLVLSLESLRRQVCMPTLRAEPTDPAVRNPIVRVATPHAMKHVLVNSFAFGGNNCSAVLSRKDTTETRP